MTYIVENDETAFIAATGAATEFAGPSGGNIVFALPDATKMVLFGMPNLIASSFV